MTVPANHDKTTTRNPANTSPPGAGEVELTQYIDKVVSGYSDKAVAATTVETDRYARAIDQRARERAQLVNAEIVLEQHVKEAVSELRSRANEDIKNFADWVKRLGFLFLGLAIQQINTIVHSNPIQLASVVWLLIDAVVALLFIVGGVLMDKPARYLTNKFKRR